MPDGGSAVEVGVLEAPPLEGGAAVLLIDLPGFHARLGVYGDDAAGDLDNARRFGLFARAVVELVLARGRAGASFDLVHAHEWPAAMVAYLLREAAGPRRPRAIVTAHNLAHQGVFPPAALAPFGLGPGHLRIERLEFFGRVNLLKGGLVAADAITTVSPTYAREILTPAGGERLDGVLRSRGRDLRGILNGIDDVAWDPRGDRALPARYGPDDPGPKAACKRALLEEIGLEPGAPLVTSLGRVVEQKGSDLLAAAIPAIVAAGASVAVAGAGDAALERALAGAAARCPGRAVYLGAVSEPLAHRLIAGADLLAMPSRWEPCGLVQLYAQRYGALPVARRTGGLADTIEDAAAGLEAGTGFLFEEPTPAALARAIARALAAMRSPRWDDLRRRVMRLELGWRAPAIRYEHLYHEILARPA